MGKSTCVKAILVALGLEAMLTTSQTDLPLPPAVSVRLDSETGQHDVIESEVLLELENDRSERIVVQRTIKGTRDKSLITVHEGPALTSPGAFRSRDFFVNRAGAASRESGFHNFLAGFLDWRLPQVQTYDGNEYPLYVQCVAPYFVVEQTRGWSTVQPPLPTHFRIREANKRTVEFLLDLDAHRNALRRQEIQFEKTQIEAAWSAQVARAIGLAERAAARIQHLSPKPVASWPPSVPSLLLVPEGEQWITLQSRIQSRQANLSQLTEQEIPRVQEIASSAQAELSRSEESLWDKQTLLSRLDDALEAEKQEMKRVETRLTAIDEDIQRNKDVRTLRTLGSRQNSSVDNGICPVCHQPIQDSLLPIDIGSVVMSLDESIDFLAEQRRTYSAVLANAKQVVESRDLQVRALREEMSALRESVRMLRQTLVSDGRLPSLAALQSRIVLENSVRSDQETEELFANILDGFGPLADRWREIEEAALRLPANDTSEEDRRKITAWTGIVRDQLEKYGFGSFPVNEVQISLDTYRPEHQGFELEASFSVESRISASDLIRTIWSYLNGMLELSRTEDTHHPGCMVFDEPKQQSTRDVSFKELLKRAAVSGQFGQQVIFFTSENLERLDSYLSGLQHTRTVIDGRVIKKLGS
ncbi:MAG TPA: hypothetical protein VN643_26030 [Pyrinomonadaceae bacterium]|nr:hypothetical protein [Pyrinomonadaceae bacterium]